jgi:hypothetical protein
MFDTRRTFSNRVANAVDLAIDFATLGEYGLEPVQAPSRPCEGRRRRSTGSWNAAIARFTAQA